MSLVPRLAAFAAAALLVGCGGGGEGGGDEGGGDGGGNTSASYDAAFDICSGGVKATADLYAVEPTEEAVTKIVMEQISGGTLQEEKSAREGCLAALAKAGN